MIRFIFAVIVIVCALAGEPISWMIIFGWLIAKALRRSGGYKPSHANMSKAEKAREKEIYRHEKRHKDVANGLGYRAKIDMAGAKTIVWWKKNTPAEHIYAVLFAGGLDNEHKWAWKSDRNGCAKILKRIRNKKERERVKAEGERLARKHHKG